MRRAHASLEAFLSRPFDERIARLPVQTETSKKKMDVLSEKTNFPIRVSSEKDNRGGVP